MVWVEKGVEAEAEAEADLPAEEVEDVVGEMEEVVDMEVPVAWVMGQEVVRHKAMEELGAVVEEMER